MVDCAKKSESERSCVGFSTPPGVKSAVGNGGRSTRLLHTTWRERSALVCLRWRNSRPSPGIIGLNKKSETWYRNGYCTIYWQFNYNYYSLPCRYLHVMTRLENDPNKTQLMLFWVYKVSSSNTKNCKSSCSILQYRPCSRRNGPWIDVLDVSIMKLTIKILSCNE